MAACGGPRNTTLPAALQYQAFAPSPTSGRCSLPLSPLPLMFQPPWASLGFFIHPKVVFALGLLHLFPLPVILFLLQGSV